jgi:hypothetical protein
MEAREGGGQGCFIGSEKETGEGMVSDRSKWTLSGAGARSPSLAWSQ